MIGSRGGVRAGRWSAAVPCRARPPTLRFLKEWGFTPQKPARRAYQQDPEAVERWLKEEYTAIQAQARREGAQVQWLDESGMRSDHTVGRSFSPPRQNSGGEGDGQALRLQFCRSEGRDLAAHPNCASVIAADVQTQGGRSRRAAPVRLAA